MAGRDLKALIAAYRDRDDLAFRRAANAIIEQEEAKRHTTLARELRRLLAAGTDMSTPIDPVDSPASPRNRETDLPLLEVTRPRRGISSLVLSEYLDCALSELVREVQRWHELDRLGIPRRHSILLFGPPGCGKTSISEALATELNRPLVRVRTEAVISSYLGETASNIAQVFEFAHSGAYIVLFDEFDSLGKMRDDPTDHGELRRVVNSVLQFIDRYAGPSLIVAATNHEQVLDSALWRRFAEVLEVGLPDFDARVRLLTDVLSARLESPVNLRDVADALEGLPHAAVERAANDALRLAVLDDRKRVDDHDVHEAVARTLRRRWS
ncbi:MAG: AAA family ATPase [Pseudonocardiaceae bacterium]